MEAGNWSPKETTRRRYCAKCQEHKLKKEVKGHKNRCFYRWCRCKNCCKIELKRNKTRINVKQRRDAILEKELAARRAQEPVEMQCGAVENLNQPEPSLLPKEMDLPYIAHHRPMPPHRDLLALERRASEDSLSQPDHPTLLPDRDISADPTDLRSPRKKGSGFVEMVRRGSVDSLSQPEPPILPKENEIPTDFVHHRNLHPQKDLLELNRRVAVDRLSHPEPQPHPPERDISTDPTDLRSPEKKNDLLDMDRRTSAENLTEPPFHPKENEILTDFAHHRTIPAQKGNAADPGQPKVPWKTIQALRDEFKDLDVHNLLHAILKQARDLDEARYLILQAAKEVAQESGEAVGPPLSHHYQWAGPPCYPPAVRDLRGKELAEGGLYNFPHSYYPPWDPLALHFHLLRALPYSYTQPSPAYAIPGPEVVPSFLPRECGELPWDAGKLGKLKPRRPTPIALDEFKKFGNKEGSSFGLHPETLPTNFSELQI